MKSNRLFVLSSLFVVAALCALVFGTINLKQRSRLRQKEHTIAQLEKRISDQEALIKVDTLLIQGHYNDALEQYEKRASDYIEDGPLGVNLRVALAKRLLNFESGAIQEELAEASLSNADDAADDKVQTPVSQEVRQLDSLSFLLTKTKVQLAQVKEQLRDRSFGEYLTFINSKGSEVHYVGQVKDGKANGYGVALLNTGSRYVGNWKDNQREGQGVYHWKDGQYYKGTFKDDKRNGQGTYYWTNGEKYVGQWKNDYRWGKGAFYAKDGKLITQGVWENDKMVTNNKTKEKRQQTK